MNKNKHVYCVIQFTLANHNDTRMIKSCKINYLHYSALLNLYHKCTLMTALDMLAFNNNIDYDLTTRLTASVAICSINSYQ